MSASFEIKSLDSAERHWVDSFIANRWSAETIVVHGSVYRPAELPGFAACIDQTPIGLVTYNIEGNACEVVSLDSLRPRLGIGYALLDAVVTTAWQGGCSRAWLVTTNDNTLAMRFYQRYGFVFSSIRLNAVAESRVIKPSIPLVGLDDIPIRDEIEMELGLEENTIKPRYNVTREGGSHRHPFHGCN
ncbi:MAG: GNAT family N-acetyltransferase [Anaerolineaceae bacterium]